MSRQVRVTTWKRIYKRLPDPMVITISWGQRLSGVNKCGINQLGEQSGSLSLVLAASSVKISANIKMSASVVARLLNLRDSDRDWKCLCTTWWRHQMETFSALLAICAGNSPVPGEFPAQKPVTWSFDVFFDLRLNKRLSKQSWGWWFETLSCPLWRHCNERDFLSMKSQDKCFRSAFYCLNICVCSVYKGNYLGSTR